MKRTQLYLDKDMWKILHVHARQLGRSISELVREAIREKYGSSSTRQRQAMLALVGLWKNRKDLPSSGKYVRQLRKGKRLGRIAS